MLESITRTCEENVFNISIHTDKRTILINGLKNVKIFSEDEQYLVPLIKLKKINITGECNSPDITSHIQCFNN